MPHYCTLGEIQRKHHIKFPREAAASYQGEGLHYEHVVTTEGFDRAYTILYHTKPPTRCMGGGHPLGGQTSEPHARRRYGPD